MDTSDIALKNIVVVRHFVVWRQRYQVSPALSKTKKLLKIAIVPPNISKNFTWKGHQLKHNKKLASTKLDASEYDEKKKIGKDEPFY